MRVRAAGKTWGCLKAIFTLGMLSQNVCVFKSAGCSERHLELRSTLLEFMVRVEGEKGDGNQVALKLLSVSPAHSVAGAAVRKEPDREGLA